MTEPLIHMQGISKRFQGVQALDEVDFEVYPGEILGLLGENGAGKSTLIKLLSGVYQPDAGSILVQGQPVQIPSPHAAQQLGIVTIYQELALVPYLSVAENIFLNREPRRVPAIGMVDFGRMRRESERLLADLHVQIPGDRKVGELTVAAQQMVEIARAISRQANIILMDEPTSALSSRETQALLELMGRLKASGVSVVFISHRLEEIRQVVDRVIVMRDGRRVATMPVAEASEEQIIRAMVGRAVGLFPKEDAPIGDVALEVRGLSGRSGVQDVSFEVRRGEIVGLAGLVGAGRTETVRLICGADPKSAGTVLIDGGEVRIHTPADAVRHGIGWVPEDRKQHGLILGMDVKQNTTLAVIRRISSALRRDRRPAGARDRRALCSDAVDRHPQHRQGGRRPERRQPAEGGAGEMADRAAQDPDSGRADARDRCRRQGRGPCADEPARPAGHGHPHDLSELPEIMGMSDRVIVMCQGRVTGEFQRHELSQEQIMSRATQYLTLDAPDTAGIAARESGTGGPAHG